VPDADEAAWEQMEQEAAQELIDWKSHPPLLVAVGGISPAKRDFLVSESNQPVVGDGDPVSIVAEIA
jgi:hypothetical protein